MALKGNFEWSSVAIWDPGSLVALGVEAMPWKILFALCCSLAWRAYGSAIVVDSHSIKDVLGYVDQDTVVVFDVNNTLMRTSQMLGSEEWAEDEIRALMKEKGWTKNEATDSLVPRWHRILRASRVVAVEPEGPELIRELQRRNLRVMACTARYVEMAYPTLDALRSIEVDLSKSWPALPLVDLPTLYSSKFIEGCLFAGLHNDKGQCLLLFLKGLSPVPKKVVFVDDKKKNVEEMGRVVEEAGLTYVGIRYGFLDDLKSCYRPEIARKQEELLDRVLTNAEAKRLAERMSEWRDGYDEQLD